MALCDAYQGDMRGTRPRHSKRGQTNRRGDDPAIYFHEGLASDCMAAAKAGCWLCIALWKSYFPSEQPLQPVSVMNGAARCTWRRRSFMAVLTGFG